MHQNAYHEGFLNGWVGNALSKFNPPKGGQSTGVGRLAPVSKTVGSVFRTPSAGSGKGLSKAPVSCITGSVFKLQK